RVIFIGFRKDLLTEGNGLGERFPAGTHFDFCKKFNHINERKGFKEKRDEEIRTPQFWKESFLQTKISPETHRLVNRHPATSVHDSIWDLPVISAGEASDVENHVAGKISDIVYARLSDIDPGGNVYDIKPKNLHGLNPEDSWYNYKRMNWVCRPAPAIPCEIRAANGYAHPIQNRAITPREAARLQGFDDDFEFEGPAKDQYRLIGNAVPPLLSKRIGESLLGVLSKL
ncbi:MAG: DNA cytosine methyltransferase, partial [Planctomycetota bacterium]